MPAEDHQPCGVNSSRHSDLLAYTPGAPVCARKILRGHPKETSVPRVQRRPLLAELGRRRV